MTDLKARLSHYLREVRRGGEVEILERGVPVARLTRIENPDAATDEERRSRLVRAGVLRPGTGAVPDPGEMPPLAISTSLLEALDEERADRV